MKKRFATDTTGDGETFVIIPEGTYIAEISAVRPGTDKNGADYWSVTLRVVSGPVDEPNPQFAGKVVLDFWSGRETPFLENQLKHRLKVFGVTNVGLGSEVELDPQQFIGQRARIDTKIEEYNGKKSAKVEPFGYSPVTGNDNAVSAAADAQADTAAKDEQGDLPF